MAAAVYAPLDVELAGYGFKTVDAMEEMQRRAQQHVRHRRRLIIAGAGLVAAVVVLTAVLVAVHTKPGAAAAAQSSEGRKTNATSSISELGEGSGSDDYWALSRPAADQQPCIGPPLACQVVNPLPLPQVDFRGLPRRAIGRRGMVAADSSRCSQIGRDVLAEGGHAADAAVATALCQGVVNPSASGLGGGAFIMIRAANGTTEFIDARETAPAAARPDMFAGLPLNASLYSGLAPGVPGELQGLGALHAAWGRLPWARLVAPAAQLARSGFAAHPYLVYILSAGQARIMATPALRETFLQPTKDGRWRLPHVGELCCKRPALADTLDKIASEGASYLARPDVAATMAAELAAVGGIITAKDLIGATPSRRQPLRLQLGELELLLAPPPSSAAVVGFVLRYLAAYASTPPTWPPAPRAVGEVAPGYGGADGPPTDGGLGLQRLIEAFKHGFAVRTALGDPGAPGGPPSPHAATIAAAVNDLLHNGSFLQQLQAATSDNSVLSDSAYGGRWNPLGAAPPDDHGTSHFSIVDMQRNAVSITSSINGGFGSGIVSPSTGILWGNTMDDFAQPNRSSMVTPHASEANFIAPGRRPLSAMSPTIVSLKKSGRLVAAAGASGGPLIITATTQTLARLLLEGADVGAAVASPRLHNQLLPIHDMFFENYTWALTPHVMQPATVSSLKARGQTPTPAGNSLGVSQAIAVHYGLAGPANTAGKLLGASDSRKDGAPLGY